MIKQAINVELLLDRLKAGDRSELRRLLNEEQAYDVAQCLSEMKEDDRNACFRLLDIENAGTVLSEMDGDVQSSILANVNSFFLIPIVSKMSPDDAVDLLNALPKQQVQEIISQMSDSSVKENIEELLNFDVHTAGGIMSTSFFAIDQMMTAKDALFYLKQSSSLTEEDIYDIYVVDSEQKLVGWISLKELLMVSENSIIANVMDKEVISVLTSVDQEEAAQIMSRYDILTLAVVDEERHLRGIITADDVFDVLQEEATEDLFQSQGIAPSKGQTNKALKLSVRKAFKARLPWLLITAVIETGSASIINHFDTVIQQTVVAASFMPLLSGVTGSVATQSTCIVIRGLNVNELSFKSAFKNIFHELRVGMLLGLCCGLFASLASLVFHSQYHNLGIIVGSSLFLTMSVGVLIGTIMPIFFGKLGIDPAHASGPFITSVLDVCTMTIYLTIVHTFINCLG